MTTHPFTRTAALPCVALLAAALPGLTPGAILAADAVPSIRKLVQKEKEILKEYGTAIVKVARVKPQRIDLDSYTITHPKANRTELALKVGYSGLISRRRFTADIKILVDSTDRDNWEVLTIKYTDNNPNLVGPNLRKIDELIKQFNR